jgi:hypothetical protein
MSAGLLASTATPGMGAPDGSVTDPVIEAWARTVDGMTITTSIT